jgi:acetyl-CoA acetyltransferase
MKEVAIIGVGMHPWGKFEDKSLVDLGAVAVREALKDAGLKWSQVQAMVAGLTAYASTDGLNAGQALAARFGETGIPIMHVFNMCATATAVVRAAYNIVASGEQDIVLAVGLDKSPKGFLGYPFKYEDDRDTDYLRWKAIGGHNPVIWAMEARRRMMMYGTTERHYALAKVAASKHGALNPDALYRKVYTVEEVMNATMVADPLTLYEICATRDGAAAAILCSAEKARQLTSKPVWIGGVGVGSSLFGDPVLRLGLLSAPAVGTAPMLSESYQSARMAFRLAGIGPKDVDFVEVPDNSSWHYLQYLETMGFCEEGEADKWVEAGDTLIGGRLPVCPSGGASSFGEAVPAQGLLQIRELVLQLRGQAGARQVKNAKVGMSQTYGMRGNSAACILKV